MGNFLMLFCLQKVVGFVENFMYTKDVNTSFGKVIKMRNKLSSFMYGRTGMDSFGMFLMIVVMAITLFSSIFFWPLMFLSYALFIYEIFRFFSRNVIKRSNENRRYVEIKGIVKKKLRLTKNKLRDRKTHRYFDCAKCQNTLRVPRGRGEIKVTCPVCKTVTIIKS